MPINPGSPTATISSIDSSVSVHLLSTGGTIHTYLDPGTTLEGVQSSISVHLLSTAGTINVALKPGTIAVKLDPGYELGSIKGINSSISVHLLSTGGTVATKIDPGYNVVNQSSTLVLQRTVSGSASGVSVSGNTMISPISSRVIKVYALQLTTTAQVHLSAKITNGAGTSPTEFWRYGLQAPSQGVAGANLAVTPPAYLFATASGSTLSLLLDSASLVHYSIGYFTESA